MSVAMAKETSVVCVYIIYLSRSSYIYQSRDVYTQSTVPAVPPDAGSG